MVTSKFIYQILLTDKNNREHLIYWKRDDDLITDDNYKQQILTRLKKENIKPIYKTIICNPISLEKYNAFVKWYDDMHFKKDFIVIED